MEPRIVFMGSPEFSLPTLKALAKEYSIIGVVTQPDRPAGRGRSLTPPPVKELAESLDLEIIQPRRLSQPEAMQQLQDWSPNVIVVAAFGQILKPAVLELPEFGCINVHASLLPRWRGAAPINAAIQAGDEQSGVTIMQMDPGVDTGPILSQRAIPIDPSETAEALSDRLAQLGAELLIETLPGYLSGEIVPRPQDETRATYAPMLKKEDGRLDFERPAEELARKVRAYDPWPGTFTDWQGGRLKILRAHPVGSKAESGKQPGDQTIYEGLPAFYTSEGLLVLDEVQPAGKRAMSGEVFLHGARDWGESE